MRESVRKQVPIRRDDSLKRIAPVRRFASHAPPLFGHDFARIAIHDAAALGTSGPGQPLPFLALIQSSFGRHDLTQIRAHVDSAATKASQAMGARAFTTGEHVAFAGRPDLRVAAHEAAHVVQQRAGVQLDGGVGRAGDAYEAQANEAADHVRQGRSSENLFTFTNVGICAPRGRTIQRDEQPAAPSLKYSRTRRTLTAPDPMWTEEALEKLLKPIFRSVSVTGVTVSMPKETKAFLLYTLYELSNTSNWGQEHDVVAPISRAAKLGDPDPAGRVTVRIDEQGNASAELVASGPVPTSPPMTIEDATAKLKTTYGFAAVRNETAKWSAEQLSDVVAAMALVPEKDRAALIGVELIRVDTIKKADGDFAGEFSVGGGVASGATTVKGPSYLKLADGAFDKSPDKFVGGTTPAGKLTTVPSSYLVILHEVGHAVEKAAYRVATEADAKAVIAVNRSFQAAEDSGKAFWKLNNEYAVLYAKWVKDPGNKALEQQLIAINAKKATQLAKNKTAFQKNKSALATSAVKAKARKATTVGPEVATALKPDVPPKKTAAATALAGAKTAVAALKPEEISSSKAYADAVEATATAVDTYAKTEPGGDIGALETALLTQIKARDDARAALVGTASAHPALASLDLAVAAQDEWISAERTVVRAPLRTLRVQKFVDLVNQKKIAPITDYAKKNWPFAPEEFYAEAYTLWINDPEYLSKNAKDLFGFFESGEFRK